jgi:hypothetical protein
MADSPPTFKMERIPEADLDIVASLAALKNGGRFSDVPSPVKDPTATVAIVTPVPLTPFHESKSNLEPSLTRP